MSTRIPISLTLLAILAGSGCSTTKPEPAPPEHLHAAMVMTKEQQASAVTTDSGVLRYEPATGEWHRLGPTIQMISSASVDPSDRETVFFACGNGVARTQDGGATWRLVTGWKESDVLQIAIDPENGDNVYAASAWGVIISHDGGDTWQYADKGLVEDFCKGIVIDRRDPSRLLLATTKGLYESRDQARNWLRNRDMPDVAVLRLRRGVSQPDTWLAGTEGRGVWVSHDDGHAWRAVAPELDGQNIYAVAVDPEDSSILAAGGWDTGVWMSTTRGGTWFRASDLPSPNITSMIFDENVPGRLWVSTFEEGTFYTDDQGRTWNGPNLYGAYVFDLVFLP